MVMGLAMSSHKKYQEQSQNCQLFERQSVDFYENFLNLKYNTKNGSVNGSQQRSVDIDYTEYNGIIQVLECGAFIEDKLTQIEECKEVLRYMTPQFRAWAKVRMPPLESGVTWQIGWIQACSGMKFVNTYGEKGCSSWEFQELDTGLYPMLSDSDGRANPWYGIAKQNVRTIVGPTTQPLDLMLMMHDNFYPAVTWSIPLPSKVMVEGEDDESDRKPRLSNVSRDQSFFTWLVARNVNQQTWYVLKTAKWRAVVDIEVNPKAAIGKRAKLSNQKMSTGSLILPRNILIPKCVLFPPNANSAQILVWRSNGSRDRTYLVVPPKITAVKYKVHQKPGSTTVIKPQISQCSHGQLTLRDDQNNQKDNDLVQEIEAYLSLQPKVVAGPGKLNKVSFLM